MEEDPTWEEIEKVTSKYMTFGKEIDGLQEVKLLDKWGLLKDDVTILELGFGYSRILKALRKKKKLRQIKKYVGIEINKHWVEEGKKIFRGKRYTFLEGDIRGPQIFRHLQERYDLILAYGIFGFIKWDFRRVLRYLRLVLKKEGRIVFSVIERPAGRAKKEQFGKIYSRSYDPREIEDILNQEGFEIRAYGNAKYLKRHLRAIYVIRRGKGKKGRPKTDKGESEFEELDFYSPGTKEVPDKETIGIFLDSLARVTGGHKRRVNMALELIRRGYHVTLLTKTNKKSKLWRGLEIPSIEISRKPIYKDFLFIGEHRFQLDEFLMGRGIKVWMHQGIRLDPPRALVKVWRDPKLIHLVFSSAMKEHIENIYKVKREKVVKAEGAVDTYFYSPGNEKKEDVVLTSKWHSGLKDQQKVVRAFLQKKGWKLKFLKGNEFEIRDQYRKAKIVLSLRQDFEGCVLRDWNNPVAEGMATQTATMVPNSRGVRDIAWHKVTTYLLDYQTSYPSIAEKRVSDKTLISALKWMIDHPKERERIAKNGYIRIQEFSYQKMIDKIIEGILLL